MIGLIAAILLNPPHAIATALRCARAWWRDCPRVDYDAFVGNPLSASPAVRDTVSTEEPC